MAKSIMKRNRPIRAFKMIDISIIITKRYLYLLFLFMAKTAAIACTMEYPKNNEPAKPYPLPAS